MLKLALVLVIIGSIGFMVLDSMTNEGLTETLCRRIAYQDARRYYYSGIKRVDEKSREELRYKCMEENVNSSVAQTLVKFVR